MASTDRSGNQALALPGINIAEQTHAAGQQGEAQLIYRTPRFNLVAGVGSYALNITDTQILDFTPTFAEPCPPFIPASVCDSSSNSTERQNNEYLYLNISPASTLWLTVGLSYDEYQAESFTVRNTSPKLGLQTRPTEAVDVRLAYFQTVKRALSLEQTIEPTQVAGFNQFFDDANGTISKVAGAGLDVHLTRRLTVGAELTHRDIKFPLIFPSGAVIEDQYENLFRGYLLWAASPRWTVRANVERSTFSRKTPQINDDPTILDTLTIPIGISFFVPSGLTGSATVSHVDQHVERLAASVFPSGTDHFTIVDAALGYLLPQRRGIVSLEVYNLFNSQFHYQDDLFRTSNQIATVPFYPCRRILSRVALNF
jgi:outer membrane receptor protein involved in Fe transport